MIVIATLWAVLVSIFLNDVGEGVKKSHKYYLMAGDLMTHSEKFKALILLSFTKRKIERWFDNGL